MTTIKHNKTIKLNTHCCISALPRILALSLSFFKRMYNKQPYLVMQFDTYPPNNGTPNR